VTGLDLLEWVGKEILRTNTMTECAEYMSVAGASALVLWGSVLGCVAQGQGGVPPLTVERVLELKVRGKEGAAYRLERSEDLVGWRPVGGRSFGVGEALVMRAVAGSGVTGRGPFFRVREELRPEGGLAPGSFAGRRVRLNAGNLSGLLVGGPAASVQLIGVGGDVTGSMRWVRTGESSGCAMVDWEGGAKDVLVFEFASEGCGRVKVERYRGDGAYAGGGSGTFLEVPVAAVPLVPPVLSAGEVVLAGAGRARLVELVAGGRALEAGKPDAVWSWAVTGAGAAKLELRQSGGATEQVVLTFTAPRCGKCVSTVVKDGVKTEEVQTRFSVVPVP
jgi:hypothetical protein